MKWKYTIKDIVLSGENINVDYTMFGRLISGRVSIPVEEFTDEIIRKRIEEDIKLRKEQIVQMRAVIDRWKGKEFGVDIPDEG